MMRRLIIDDCRTMEFPDGETVHARTNEEAKLLLLEEWDEVWFDYDLGGVYGQLETIYESTVMPTVDAILYDIIVLKQKPKFDVAVVHTMNPTGREQIALALEGHY